MEEDPTLSQRQVADRLDRDVSWVNRIVKWGTSVADAQQAPFGGPSENEARYARQVKQTLRDPQKRKRAMVELEPADLEAVRSEATYPRRSARRRSCAGPSGVVDL